MQTIKKATFLLNLFLIITLFSYGQKQANDSLSTLVVAITKSNVYEVSYTVGFAGTISKQYQRFIQLLSVATNGQLFDLATQNKNAVVRLYAFQALKQKNAQISDGLIKQFQQDKTIVVTLNGCDGDKKTVAELSEVNFKSIYELKNK